MITTDESVLNATTRLHQPGQVADFSISLPPSVDVCPFHVTIIAGNSAGMYLLIEEVEVGELQFDLFYQLNAINRLFSPVCLGVSTAAPAIINATTTTTTIVSTGGDPTTAVDDHQQGDSTTLIGTPLHNCTMDPHIFETLYSRRHFQP